MTIKSRTDNASIQGKADWWCLAYSSGNSTLTALIVLESSQEGASLARLPGLIIYLAAAPKRRKKSGETNCSVFGLLTDSMGFVFVYLDENRNLYASGTNEWAFRKNQIIRWIDTRSFKICLRHCRRWQTRLFRHACSTSIRFETLMCPKWLEKMV